MGHRNDKSKAPDTKEKRAYISIYWRCCHTYSRVYRNATHTAYEGRCPRCKGFLKVPIGKEGTTQRTFIAE